MLPLFSSPPTNRASPTERRWLTAAAIVGLFTVFGLLKFGYLYLDDVTRARSGTAPTRLIEELTGAYVGALLFPAIVWFARRFPLDRRHWLERLPLHLVALTASSVTMTALRYASRSAIFPLVGLGTYDYGIMRYRYLMEFPNDALEYAIIVGFVYLFDHYRATRDHEVRAAQLESRLAQAQLQNLRLQLNPHFLFNALNTVSSVMYDDPRAADAVLARLSELLRLTLRGSQAQETTLGEELHLLSLYVEVMRARFEERLRVDISAQPGTERALVPQLILQPLVENSIRHGLDPSSTAGTIEVRCTRENGTLLLEVRDHGRGLAEPPSLALNRGIGLSNTAARLAHLYGDSHRLELRDAEGGGLRVTVALPFRLAGTTTGRTSES